MGHVSYTELRQNLARTMDEAVATRSPIVVTRQGKASVVIMSADEFAGWQETVHLLSSPANAARLLRSIRSADAGEVAEQPLVEPGSAIGA